MTDQIERLEKTVRALQRRTLRAEPLSIIEAVVILAFFALGATPNAVQDVIEAKKLIIRDAAGNARAQLYVQQGTNGAGIDNSVVFTLSGQGPYPANNNMELTVNNDTSQLILGENRQGQVALWQNGDSKVGIVAGISLHTGNADDFAITSGSVVWKPHNNPAGYYIVQQPQIHIAPLPGSYPPHVQDHHWP